MKQGLYIFIIIASFSLLYGTSPSQEGSDPFIQDPIVIGRHTKLKHYHRNRSATKNFKDKRSHFCFWYNPEIWEISDQGKWNEHDIAEISFKSTVPQLFSTILVEKVAAHPHHAKPSIYPQEIRELVWERIEDSFNNVTLVREDERVVNGTPVKSFLWRGYYDGDNEHLTKGDLYYFYVYVLAGADTIQVVTFCREDLFEKEEKTMLDFLNGITLNCQ